MKSCTFIQKKYIPFFKFYFFFLLCVRVSAGKYYLREGHLTYWNAEILFVFFLKDPVKTKKKGGEQIDLVGACDGNYIRDEHCVRVVAILDKPLPRMPYTQGEAAR